MIEHGDDVAGIAMTRAAEAAEAEAARCWAEGDAALREGRVVDAVLLWIAARTEAAKGRAWRGALRQRAARREGR